MNVDAQFMIAFLTGVMALLLAVCGFIQKRIHEIRQYTFNLLTIPIVDPAFQETTLILKNLFAANTEIAPTPDGSIKNEDHIITILNYFQTLALGLEMKVLDKSVLIKFRGHQMAHFFSIAEPYINRLRILQNRPFLFSEYEHLVQKNLGKHYLHFKGKISQN